jgi:hypothetical protein
MFSVAFAAKTYYYGLNAYNKTYAKSYTVGGVNMIASGTTLKSTTDTTNDATGNYYCTAFIYKYDADGNILKYSYNGKTLAYGSTVSTSTARSPKDTNIYYIHRASRYGTTNSSYANSSTLVTTIDFKVTQDNPDD